MYWFYYRNRIKRTHSGRDTFTNTSGAIPLTFASSQLLAELESLREQILTILIEDDDPDSTKDDNLEEILRKYYQLFRGFIYLPTESSIRPSSASTKKLNADKSKIYQAMGKSPLRRLFRFKWDDSITDAKVSANDTLFELISMITNHAIWLMHWCQNISLSLPMNYLPQHVPIMQKIFRRAAGEFQIAFQIFQPQLPEQLHNRIDSSNVNILQAYYYQCLAEGWELWFLRILQNMVVFQDDRWKLKPYGGSVDPKSISRIASNIYEHFNQSMERIQIVKTELINLQRSSDANFYNEWLAYLEIKSYYFQAWNYLANSNERWLIAPEPGKIQQQLQQELKEIEKHYTEMKNFIEKYNSLMNKSPENQINKESMLVEYRLYSQMLQEQVDKLERSVGINSLFDDRIQSTMIPKAMEPIQYLFPEFDKIWNSNFYSEFGVHLPREAAEALAAQIKRQKEKEERKLAEKNSPKKKQSPFNRISRIFKRKSPHVIKSLSSKASTTDVNFKSPKPYLSPRKIPFGHEITPIPVPDRHGKNLLASAPLVIPESKAEEMYKSNISSSSSSRFQKIKSSPRSQKPISPSNRSTTKIQQQRPNIMTVLKKSQDLNRTTSLFGSQINSSAEVSKQ